MLCSEDSIIQERIDEYAYYFALVGWNKQKAKSEISRAAERDRDQLLTKPKRKEKKTYDPRLPSKGKNIICYTPILRTRWFSRKVCSLRRTEGEKTLQNSINLQFRNISMHLFHLLHMDLIRATNEMWHMCSRSSNMICVTMGWEEVQHQQPVRGWRWMWRALCEG